MTSWSFSYSAQCLVRQWLWEMTSWKWSYSAQCLVRHWIHGAASLRGHSTGAALGQGCHALIERCNKSGGAAVAVPLQGRQHPRRCAETASHGLLLHYIDKVVDVPWFWCTCVCVRIRRYGQGLRSRSPWLVLVLIAVFGYGDVGKDCALALLGLVLVFIPVVAQRQLPWSAFSADYRDCPVAAH